MQFLSILSHDGHVVHFVTANASQPSCRAPMRLRFGASTIMDSTAPMSPVRLAFECCVTRSPSFRFLGMSAAVSFEISAFAPPAAILPLPHGAYGVLSPSLPQNLVHISRIPEQIRPKIFENQQRCLAHNKNSYSFLIWEPWGVPPFTHGAC